MSIVRTGLLVAAVAVLLALSLEDLLVVGLTLELGVPRAIRIAAAESALFLAVALTVIWRAALWRRRAARSRPD